MAKNQPRRLPRDNFPRAFKGDQEQFEAFVRAARELGADEREETFDLALKRIAQAPPQPKRKPKKQKPGQ